MNEALEEMEDDIDRGNQQAEKGKGCGHPRPLLCGA